MILAIALGTAGFVTIVTMGRDLKKNFGRDLELLGKATIIRVFFEHRPSYLHQWFYPSTIKALQQIKGVRNVSLVATHHLISTPNKGQSFIFTVMAVDSAFWDVNGLTPRGGRLFTSGENNARRRVAILGPELANTILGRVNAVGSRIEIQQDLYQVSGVLNGVGLGDLAHYAFVPLTTGEDRIVGISPANRIYLRCHNWDDVEKVAPLIEKVVKSAQNVQGLRVEVAWEQLRRVKSVFWWVELFIYSSIAATLILGGVGICTVMLAAVRSRTREIGLKKAMGAEDRSIMAQFLAEAICLSTSASLIGSFLGFLSVELLSYMLKSHPGQSLFLVCVTMGLLMAVALGIAAGLYPSIQASRMEVVSAIRYE